MLSVTDFIDTCREIGLNVTYQRILIYKSLIKTRSHPTAEEIYSDVKLEYPSISLATVYKTLETLAENKLIGKVTPLHDLARYDGDTEPHHHLVCLECRGVSDIHDPSLNKIPLPEQEGFTAQSYRIQFEGICQDCQNAIDAEKKRLESGNMTFCGKAKN
ncbi:MAG: Fur family transcriptional regulator [Calditrichia bacterium]